MSPAAGVLPTAMARHLGQRLLYAGILVAFVALPTVSSSSIVSLNADTVSKIGDSGIENLLLFQFQHNGWAVDIQDDAIKGFAKEGEKSSAPTKELGKIRDLINLTCRILPKDKVSCLTASEDVKSDFGKVFSMIDLDKPSWMAIRLSKGSQLVEYGKIVDMKDVVPESLAQWVIANLERSIPPQDARGGRGAPAGRGGGNSRGSSRGRGGSEYNVPKVVDYGEPLFDEDGRRIRFFEYCQSEHDHKGTIPMTKLWKATAPFIFPNETVHVGAGGRSKHLIEKGVELQCTHPGGCKGPPDLFIIPLRDGTGCFELDDPPVFNRSITKVMILAPEPVYLFGERSVNPALATYVDLVLDIKIDHEYAVKDSIYIPPSIMHAYSFLEHDLTHMKDLLQPEGYSREDAKKIAAKKSEFCIFLYSNCGVQYRNLFYDELSKYKQVTAEGKCKSDKTIQGYHDQNNPKWKGRSSYDTSIEMNAPYKFAITFENSVLDGYVSEKIMTAMLAGSIPIYYGTSRVLEFFNPKAFIYCGQHAKRSVNHNIANVYVGQSQVPAWHFDECIKQIKEIDSDEEKYLDMLMEPWFPNNEVPDILRHSNLGKRIHDTLMERYPGWPITWNKTKKHDEL